MNERPGSARLPGLQAEEEGLEPPRACARRISSALPYQLGLLLRKSPTRGCRDGVEANHAAGPLQPSPGRKNLDPPRPLA